MTIADIVIGSTLIHSEKLNMLFDVKENIYNYLNRLKQRPAYRGSEHTGILELSD